MQVYYSGTPSFTSYENKDMIYQVSIVSGMADQGKGGETFLLSSWDVKGPLKK